MTSAAASLSAPIVASAQTKDGKGYWLAGADGAVYSFGNAHYYGSMAGHPLTSPIVGMAATPSGKGYILLGADGGIFTFGDARFYGSTGNMRLNARVLDLAITANGKGYWFVGADGGVFTFGNARFYGSTGSMHLAAPVMSMTSSAKGHGYWMVAADGGIFAFNVPFEGSMPSVRALNNAPLVPTVRMRALASGRGYYLLGADGAVYSFGTARSSVRPPASTPSTSWSRSSDHGGLPGAFGPAAAAAAHGEAVQVVDHRFGIVAELSRAPRRARFPFGRARPCSARLRLRLARCARSRRWPRRVRALVPVRDPRGHRRSRGPGGGTR